MQQCLTKKSSTSASRRINYNQVKLEDVPNANADSSRNSGSSVQTAGREVLRDEHENGQSRSTQGG